MAYGTNAQRLAFTPSVPTPASGPSQAYIWYETDTTDTYAYASGAWHKVNTTGGLSNAATFQNSGGNASGTTFDGSAARTIGPDTFGLGTANSPQFAGVNVGHASDTTITRTGAGDIAVEGNAIYRAGGTDVPVTDGGTGVSTLTNHGVVLGQGASAVAATAAGSAGQLLTSGGASADPSWANPPIVMPQGRLSLVTATPVMTSDQTAKGTIYYAEYTGNCVPVYDGTTTRILTFSNLSLILDSTNHLLENLYDVYLYSSSGTATLGASPAWVNTATVTWTSASPGVCTWTAHGLYEGAPVIFTAGTSTPTGITAGTTYYVSKTGLTANAFSVSTTVANAAAGTNVNTSSTGVGTQTGTNHTTIRGTGAGTTELQLKNGIWTNKNSITLFNNSVSSGAISANQATYLGTFYCTANGQTGVAFRPAAANGGTSNILGLYNAYNQIHVTALCRDAGTGTDYTYNSTTWRAANGNVLNRIAWVDGLQQAIVHAHNSATVYSNTAIGIGYVGSSLDSTTGTPNTAGGGGSSSTAAAFVGTGTATDMIFPQLGFHYLQRMERVSTGTATFAVSATNLQPNGLTVTIMM